MPNGTLDDVVKKRLAGRPDPRWGATQWTKALFGIAAIMAMLHSKSVIHRDLKPSNVMLDANFEVCLGDFGLAKVFSPTVDKTASIGSPLFMAPELHNEEDYSFPVDVYPYGVSVFWTFSHSQELNAGRMKNNVAIIQRICAGDRLKRPPEGSGNAIPEGIWGLIEKCWEHAPPKRATFKEIVEMFEDRALWIPGTDVEEFLEYKERMMPGVCPDVGAEEFEVMERSPRLKKAKIADVARRGKFNFVRKT
jgi:serine/threonine protein kinase